MEIAGSIAHTLTIIIVLTVILFFPFVVGVVFTDHRNILVKILAYFCSGFIFLAWLGLIVGSMGVCEQDIARINAEEYKRTAFTRNFGYVVFNRVGRDVHYVGDNGELQTVTLKTATERTEYGHDVGIRAKQQPVMFIRGKDLTRPELVTFIVE